MYMLNAYRELSAAAPPTAVFAIQPIQTFAEDVIIWAAAPQRSVNT